MSPAAVVRRMVEQGNAVLPPLKGGGTTAPSKIYARKRKPAVEEIRDVVDTVTKVEEEEEESQMGILRMENN